MPKTPSNHKRKIFAGRYAYMKPLGRGAGGAVYLCEDLQYQNRRVALKVLSAEAFATVQGKMIKREFEILSKLDHPNLVRVYDYGSMPDGGVFLAEEYIDGFSMQDARALIDPEGLIDVTLQMLQGLSYLHGMGMIHRDIKPANVMLLWLDDADARPMVKLVDFGLSSADPKRDTLRGGTRSYMAPEIIRGEKGELRSDLYSLGVTLYYAMCGVLPFGPRTKADPPPTEEDFRPPEPHRLNPEVPLSISRFTMVLLRQLAEFEYADAGEALQALAGDTESLEWVATGQLANSLDIAAPPVLRGYFERGILVRQDAQRGTLVEDLSATKPTGKLYLIRGSEGVGKSRLLRETSCSMKLAGRIVISISVDADGPPYSLLLKMVKQLLGVAESRGLQVGDRFRPRINMLERLAPWLEHSRTEDRDEDLAWIREAIEDVIVMLHPDKVVMEVENIHLGDRESTAFLQRWFDSRHSANRPDVVASMCPGERTDALAVLTDVDVVEVEGLRGEDVRYFFEERLGVTGLTEDWVGQVATMSRGNPSYIEELSRHLIDAGILGRRSSISWDVKVKELLEFPLPKGQSESLRRRLSALGTLGRETLELMSIINRRVEWSVLRKLLIAGGETPEDAERTMELLLWRHFAFVDLEQSGRYLRLIAPELADVIISRINPEWKRSLHRRIGERLRKEWLAGRAGAFEAAVHLEQGGKEDEARTFYELAGDGFYNESDFPMAMQAYGKAMELGAAGPGSVVVRTKLAEAAIKNHEVEPAIEQLDAAWTDAERTALDWLMYRVCVVGAKTMLTLGRAGDARDWLERLKDSQPTLSQQAEVVTLRSMLAARRGEVADARKRLQNCVAQCQHFGNRDGLVRAMSLLARIEVWTGRTGHAETHFDDAVEIGGEGALWGPLGDALCGRAILERVMGRLDEANETLQQAFEIVSEHGNVDLWIECLLEMGETALAIEDPEAARRRGSEAKRLAEPLGHTIFMARADMIIGQVAARDGEEGAFELVAKAEESLSGADYSFPWAALATHQRGELLVAHDRKDEGAVLLQQAEKIAAEQGLVLPE